MVCQNRKLALQINAALQWIICDAKDIKLNGNRRTYWIPTDKIKGKIGTGYNTGAAFKEFIWQVTKQELKFGRIKAEKLKKSKRHKIIICNKETKLHKLCKHLGKDI